MTQSLTKPSDALIEEINSIKSHKGTLTLRGKERVTIEWDTADEASVAKAMAAFTRATTDQGGLAYSFDSKTKEYGKVTTLDPETASEVTVVQPLVGG